MNLTTSEMLLVNEPPPPPPPAEPAPADPVPAGIETVGRITVDHPRMTSRNVSVMYGDKMGIEDVSLDIGMNEVLAIIGPSGCGKSTFLRCLNRMNDTVDICRVTGTIRLDGEDVHDPRLDVVQLRARVGMVFQKPNPFPKSIYDNVAYGPQIHGLAESRRETDEVVQRSLEKAGLWNEVRDRLEQPGTGLSGGQQQRLCIARAIAVSPEVILMDEPCSALDPIATARIEGTHRRAAGELHHRDRDPFDAAGGPRLATHRVLPPWAAHRGRGDEPDLHQPPPRSHRGLHHRPFRLIRRRLQGASP